MEENKSVEINTYEGKVEYVFEGEEEEEDDCPREEEEKKEEPKKKKKKKDKKKKKKKKEKTTVYWWWWWWFIVLGLTIASGMYLYSSHEETNTVFGISGKHNMSSVPYSREIEWNDLAPTLNEYLKRSNRYHVLCMHHLRLPPGKLPYRGCSVRVNQHQIYHMLNPQITKMGEKTVLVEEKSIRQKDYFQQKHRYQTAELKWTDLAGNQLTSVLSGPPVIALQLAIEEFE